MVCVAISNNNSTTSATGNKNNRTSLNRSPLKKWTSSQKKAFIKATRTSSPCEGKSAMEMEHEYKSLKKLLPSVSGLKNVSDLEVVLEAIQYIRQLEKQLCTMDPVLLKEAFMASASAISGDQRS